jgi:drug/metabolite transporter (DMT)-like permease
MPYAKRHVTNLPFSPCALAAAQAGVSALITLPGALFSGILVYPLRASAVWGILGLGVLGTGIAYVWNHRNIELAGSVIASSVT